VTGRPRDDGPVIPDRADDDRDRGWGDDADSRDADDERLTRERPPHWG
jgi:hypothetical protein